MFCGLGRKDRGTRGTCHDAASAVGREISVRPLRHVAIALPEGRLSPSEAVLAFGPGFFQGCQGPGLRKKEKPRFSPIEISLIAPTPESHEEVASTIVRAVAEAKSVSLTREWVNLPPCDKTPEVLADQAKELAEAAGIEVTILDEPHLRTKRMGSMLGVAQGSDNPPRLVVLRYQNAPKGKGGHENLFGLVGKGVTFDSGGLSLKTNEQMLDMKSDMAGAATVIAAMLAIASLRLPVNVLGVTPLVENMPSGKAFKLGDVLHARNGKTIEITNTDAEGRLILADALTFAVDHGATHLLDLATLTGACVIALGTEVAGLMSNNEPWGDRVRTAAWHAGEKVWPLPLDDHYEELLKSKVADLKNAAGHRYGGAIGAGKFLQHFVADTPWVHLDIAGPAWAEHDTAIRDSGGTGFFVRSIVELMHRTTSEK
jgi:leucyl aminopeptidase